MSSTAKAAKPVIKPKAKPAPVVAPVARGAAQKPALKPAKPAARVAAPVKPTPAPAARVATKPAATPAAKPTTNGHAKPASPAAARPSGKSPAGPLKPLVKAPSGRTEPAKPVARVSSTLRVEAAIPIDKDLSIKTKQVGNVKDRMHLTAPDAYWLHVYWELSLQSVQRAEAALNQDWHGAKPIIRLFDVSSTDTTSTSEAILRDIVVHGGCNHWYIDVPQPPKTYRADIGYLTRTGRFFALARSNVLTSPKAGASEALNGDMPPEAGTGRKSDETAGETRFKNEDAFRRPLKENPFGTGAVLPGKLKKFFFDLDAELIVYVKTDPAATVTLQNEPVKINPDGTATMRFSLPDSRQIIPAVATSGDGMEEQTIVLAVERNTKRLDPMMHDLYSDV